MSVVQQKQSALALFRSLYRELSSQYVEIARSQADKDLFQAKTLNDYRAKIGKEPVKLPINPGSIRKSSYDSSKLRELFQTGSENHNAYAKEAATFLTNQHQYKVLIDRYNPGLNMDDEERVRLSAKRVGLELPEDFKSRIGME